MRDTILRINSIANWKNLFIAFLAAALVACGGSGGSSSSTSNSPIYTIVFDAGSSGTRGSLFKVIPGNGGYPQVTLLDGQSYEDNGINDFLPNPGLGTIDLQAWNKATNTWVDVLPGGVRPQGCDRGTDVYDTSHGGSVLASVEGLGADDVGPCVLQPILDSMAGAMSAAGITPSQVKVELFATAGMRTMSQFNGGSYLDSDIATFYQIMKQYVQSKGYAVGDFMTSNGNSQEGIWTWVNLNDLYYNAFGGNTTYYSGAPTTRGDFEVGGSSMQIAFPTSSIPVGENNNVYAVTINGRSYNVFSKTYLGLGGDDARKFVRSYNYNNTSSPSSTYTGLDCFPTNASAAYTKEDSGVALFNASFFPTVTTPSSSNSTGTIWTTVLSNTASPLVMSAPGNFNLSSCTTKYNDVTSSVMALPRNNYGTLGQSGLSATYADFIEKVGTSTSPFVGLDGFYYTANSLGLAPSSQLKSNFTQAQFKDALDRTCPDSQTGPTGYTIRPMSICANATYMNNFLWRNSNSGGLFNSSTNATFEGVVPSKIGNSTILTWTRGYLLLKYAN